jgi:hypothetical protein
MPLNLSSDILVSSLCFHVPLAPLRRGGARGAVLRRGRGRGQHRAQDVPRRRPPGKGGGRWGGCPLSTYVKECMHPFAATAAATLALVHITHTHRGHT